MAHLTVVERFKRVCIVRADLSKVAVERRDGDISPYYVKDFDVVFICGPELKAQIRWKENVSCSFDGARVYS